MKSRLQRKFEGVVRASLFALSMVLVAVPSVAVMAQDMELSAEQIEKIKRMPRAQQEAIARQFGMSLSELEAQAKTADTSTNSSSSTMQPRKGTTQTDEEQRPLNELSPSELEKRLAEDDSALQPYGYEIFSGEPTSFNVLNNTPVPADYILGPGDVLRIQLYGKSNSTVTATIDNEGMITLDSLGPLSLAGLSYDEAKELIRSTVKERMIGMEAAVSMSELRSIQIFVVGEAYKPGAYTVSSLSTVSQALFASGGVSEIASLRAIQVKRGGDTLATFDLYKLLTQGDAQNDVRLQSGDVVFIPTRGETVSVDGEVLRPAIYELKDKETLRDVLTYAGGLLPTAYKRTVQVERIHDGVRRIETVDLTKQGATYDLQSGDNVAIAAVAEEPIDSVMLIGAAVRPGAYEWREGMRVKDLIPGYQSALLPVTDLTFGLLVRTSDDRRRIKVHQFDVARAINGVDSENLVLQPRDQVVVFSRYESVEAEKNQLASWLKTESEKAREERRRVVEIYRKQYLDRLIGEGIYSQEIESDEPEASAQLDRQLGSLFALEGRNEEDRDEDYYSQFSRYRLLQPVLYQLRNQFSATGTLPLVYINGEVRFPGIYPLTENADAQSLITAAGGLRESAYLARAEITRTRINSSGEATSDYVPFNVREVLNGETSIALQGRDRVQVLPIPQWQNTLEVALEGEVRFPGTYTIRRGETLSSLIARAGGFTDFAFLRGSVFTREDLREAERRRLGELAQQLRRDIASNTITDSGNTVAYGEMNQLLSDLTNVEAVGRLIIDLETLLASNGNQIQLKDGDRLFVPTVQNTVSIIGEVQLASSYQHQAGISLEQYIERAGGLRQKADDERIYVVKANGSVMVPERRSWFSSGDFAQIEPGDTIVVPMDTQYMNNIELWSTATQIMYQVGVALAALSGL